MRWLRKILALFGFGGAKTETPYWQRADQKDDYLIGEVRDLEDAEVAPYLKKGTYEGPAPKVTVTRWSLLRGAGKYGPEGFYYDASEAFLLSLGEDVLACIAFEIDQEGSTVYIKQIQSKLGPGLALSFFKWERLLVGVVTDWARKSGFREVHVQPAVKNKYWSETDEERNARFRIRYDVTAKRLGFRYDSERECFAKTL